MRRKKSKISSKLEVVTQEQKIYKQKNTNNKNTKPGINVVCVGGVTFGYFVFSE